MRIGDPQLHPQIRSSLKTCLIPLSKSLSVISPSSTHLLQRDRISEKCMHLISRSMLSTNKRQEGHGLQAGG